MSLRIATRRTRLTRRGGGAWSPADLPGLETWWDFADASTLYTDDGSTPVSSDGDLIYRVNDKSGNNRHLTQSTSSRRPQYKTNVFNGNSVGRSDGTDDYLLSAVGSYAAKTIVGVSKKDGAIYGWYPGIVMCRNTSPPKTGNSNEARGFGGSNSKNTVTGLGSVDAVYIDGVSGNVTNYLAFATGIDIGAGTAPHIVSDLNSASAVGNKYFVVGADPFHDVNGQRSLDGDLLEIIIMSEVLSTGDHNALGEYLGDKWGITWNPVS